MKHRSTSFLMVLILVASTGCSKPVAGRWVAPDNKTDIMELKSDGTYVLVGTRHGGTYVVDGEKITFALDTGAVFKGQVKGNVIFLNGGKYIKQ